MTSEDLRRAVRAGQCDVVEDLLDNLTREDVDSVDDDGLTALHWAAVGGRNDVVHALLHAQAEVNAVTDDFSTPLHFAARFGHNAVVRTLLENNASVDELTDYCESPLHAACSGGHFHCVLTLLAAGAEALTKRSDSRAAVDLAVEASAGEIVTLMVAVGADLADPLYRGFVHFSESSLELARRDIAKVRLDFVRHRALQVCIGLQSLDLDALQTCEILQFACGGALASLIPFHQWWAIATTVKHFTNK